MKRMTPNLDEERALFLRGFHLIAGIDEAGRGAMAGPVVAGAVILPWTLDAQWAKMVKDSKFLTRARREYLYGFINNSAIATGVGIISPEIIDEIGIAAAARQAMKEAVGKLDPQPEILLIDYFTLPEVILPQKGVADGDSLCFSIACASIVAKVTRDRIMDDLDACYPGYGFSKHKGYLTSEHQDCLRKLGPCPIHRRSFSPIRDGE